VSIESVKGTCIVVHLADSETHFRDPAGAQNWAETLPADIQVRAIENAQVPCWMAYCDNPACEHPEGDENDNATHLVGDTAAEAEQQLNDLRRTAAGVLLCTLCREERATA
jgi:hypothetical protein